MITGGTSRLGSAFIHKALKQNARVFFTYHQATEDAKALIQLGAAGFCLDLSKTPAIDEFVKAFKTQTDTLDVLIHNAAAVRDRTLGNLTEEDWDVVMAVNLKAPYYLTKKLLSYFLKGKPKDGAIPKKILMISSRVAIQGGFGVSNYAASKAGLIGLAKSLAQELGKRKILVNVVNPGFMKSRMTDLLPPDVIETNRLASPLESFSDPDEVADFLIYLCSDQMTQVTGQTFHFESRKT